MVIYKHIECDICHKEQYRDKFFMFKGIESFPDGTLKTKHHLCSECLQKFTYWFNQNKK